MDKLGRHDLAAYNATRIVRRPTTLCYAPETSLNFFTDGRATACCAGRSYPLGAYPEQSVREIWEGRRARSLRAAVRRNDLSKGCGTCAANIRAGNHLGTLAQNFDAVPRHAGIALMPRAPQLKVLELEISNVCNLECTMCNGYNSSAIRKHREGLEPLPNPYDAGFVEQLREFMPDLWEARFLGGEPFLVPMYFDIWDALLELNPTIRTVITTNGTVMNRRVREVLEQLRPGIVVSCDSMDAATYEAIRVHARLEKVLENIEIFRQSALEHGTHFGIAVCPMPQSWRTIPGVVEFCNERAIPICFNTVLHPESHSLAALPPAEVAEVHEFLAADHERQAAGEHGAVASENLAAYLGLVRQVAAARSSATRTQPVVLRGRRRSAAADPAG